VTVEWSAATSVSGQGTIDGPATVVRVEITSAPTYLSHDSGDPIRYRFLGRVGAVASTGRDYGTTVVYPDQLAALLIPGITGIWYDLALAVEADIYLGMESGMSGPSVACRVYATGAQTLTTSVAAALTFDAETSDDWAMHSASVNPTRITVSVPGWYVVGGSVRIVNNATGGRYGRMVRNGTGRLAESGFQSPADGTDARVSVETAAYLAAGDYIEFVVFQTSGGNLDTIPTGVDTPAMWALRVA